RLAAEKGTDHPKKTGTFQVKLSSHAGVSGCVRQTERWILLGHKKEGDAVNAVPISFFCRASRSAKWTAAAAGWLDGWLKRLMVMMMVIMSLVRKDRDRKRKRRTM